MAQQLYECLTFIPTLLTESTQNGRKIVEGIFQRSDVKNANGRIYPKTLWEKVLTTDKVLKSINERRMYGELDHPNDGKVLLARASHLITKLWMNEANEICGRAEILGTPGGKIIEALVDANATFGISSRAKGTTTKTALGEMVNENDFDLETFDFVANPSTPGAYPKQVMESEDNDTDIKENSMASMEKFKLLEQRAGTVLGIDNKRLDSNSRTLSEGAAADLIVEATRLSADAPELKDLTASLIEQLNGKRKEFRTPLNEETVGSAEQGWIRTVPQLGRPGPGEGWPFNPADEGILAGINNGVDEFMKMAESKGEDSGSEDEEEDEKEKETPAETTPPAGPPSSNEDVQDGLLTNIAKNMLSLKETAGTKPVRAFAAAYLLEREKRINEADTFNNLISKMQVKYKALVEQSNTSEAMALLEEKYNLSLQIIEELRTQHNLLSAKVYAEKLLEKSGLISDQNAVTKISEAIAKAPTKASIDEAFALLVPIRGTKVPEKKPEIKEAAETEKAVTKLAEGVAALNEVTQTEASRGADLAKRISAKFGYSRSK